MAVISDADRWRAVRHFIDKLFVQSGVTANFDTVALKAAVDATDDWIDTNAGSYNSALPAFFRSTATLEQKTLLFCYVALRRAGINL